MTREEKQKAIDALKISAPVMAVTQEEFNDYIHILNHVMDWLEQESKTGHWIKSMRHECTYSDSDDNKLYEYVIHYKCSLCGFETGTQAEYFDYCPDCGARMVEPQERR